MSAFSTTMDSTGAASICRGIVMEVDEHGMIEVLAENDRVLACEALHSGREEGAVSPGDVVLVWESSRPHPAVVLGRVGPVKRGLTPLDSQGPSVPAGVVDELVLEAKKMLTLRVGDGSITLREDGKILIKGKDLVSHARRANRIKGGSVSIN